MRATTNLGSSSERRSGTRRPDPKWPSERVVVLITERPSEERIHEAMGVNGVDTFVVTCPKDVTMYKDAVKTTGFEEELVVKDLIELVHEAM